MPSHALPRAARVLLYLFVVALVVLPSPVLVAQNGAQNGSRDGARNGATNGGGNGTALPPLEPNYAAAAAWTTQKVSKLVFDTTVSPRWLEKSDRFWYAFQTREGRRFYLVDPVKKAKAPLFDHVKLAAALTSITRIPYDAQHLPFSSVRFVKDETAFEFDVQVPADAKIDMPKPPITTDEQQGTGGNRGNGFGRDKGGEEAAVFDDPQQTQGNRGQVQQGQRGRQGGRGGRDGGPARPRNRTLTFEYELDTGRLALLGDRERERPVRWASISPDKTVVLFARNHNLFMMDAGSFEKAKKDPNDSTIVETQLTKDGEKYYSFARNDGSGRGQNQQREQEREDDEDQEIEEEGDEENRRTAPINVIWSRDSSRFALIRRDTRQVKDLWVINAIANPRPTLETYRYAMPGEEHVPQSEMHVFDVAAKAGVQVKADRFTDQSMSIATKPRPAGVGGRGGGRGGGGRGGPPPPPAEWLSDSPDKVYFTRLSRDMHRLDVGVADAATGEVTTLVEERLNTYIESKPLRLVSGQTELLFWSERDGWGHYYRYDAATGALRNRITEGEFVTTGIDHVDEANRTVYITAAGREKGEDPYYTHLYRVGLDGTGLTLLNPGDASHSTSMPESGRWFVDNASRVDSAPESTLRDAEGTVVAPLETPDLSALMEVGFRFPEPFTVKADDGITDLYGVMYKPFDFDPNRKYPIIAYVYPGPQTESVTKTFNPRSSNISLAQFGFIVVEVGNRGGHPTRSKWYHNYGYGNLRDYGLADKKAAIEHLARRHPFIDIDRVGIWGHSGGGFMTAAAMLVYPDFFKVGWSESGNHENNIYNNTWSEKHHGIREIERDGEIAFEYDIEKNSELAKNLKGRLMLITGDLDNNVHPAGTYRLADALIKANKRFDMFVLPGVRHSFASVSGYVTWLRGDYFARHLLGRAADSVDIVELNREVEQTGERGRGARR